MPATPSEKSTATSSEKSRATSPAVTHWQIHHPGIGYTNDPDLLAEIEKITIEEHHPSWKIVPCDIQMDIARTLDGGTEDDVAKDNNAEDDVAVDSRSEDADVWLTEGCM
jgi:hypothetical protein